MSAAVEPSATSEMTVATGIPNDHGKSAQSRELRDEADGVKMLDRDVRWPRLPRTPTLPALHASAEDTVRSYGSTSPHRWWRVMAVVRSSITTRLASFGERAPAFHEWAAAAADALPMLEIPRAPDGDLLDQVGDLMAELTGERPARQPVRSPSVTLV